MISWFTLVFTLYRLYCVQVSLWWTSMMNVSHIFVCELWTKAPGKKSKIGLENCRIFFPKEWKPWQMECAILPVPLSRLLHFYLTVIRPVIEYCSVVWHYGLTKAQSETLEAIQCRALLIIYHWHALNLCTQSCQLAFSSQQPWTY